jgi:phosphonate C-P lyase system protein PhnG
VKIESPTVFEDLLETILYTDDQTDHNLLKLLADEAMTLVREPSLGTIMMTVTDGSGQDFHLGEVLITEAALEYQQQVFYAWVVGDHPQKALARAAVEAVLEKGPEPLRRRLIRILTHQLRRRMDQRKHEEHLLISSRVEFETMRPW